MCKTVRSPISPRPLLTAVLVLVVSSPPVGAEPESVPERTARQLLDAVAERGYHDTALLILDRLAADSELSEEFRLTIPLRRAAALIAAVRREPDPAKRQAVYTTAGEEIDRLLAAGNAPAVVAEAALQRGLLLLEQGRLQAATEPAAAADLFGRAVAAFVAPAGAGPVGGSARVAAERELAEVNGRLAAYRKQRVLSRQDRQACEDLEEQRELLRGRLIQLELLAAEATAERARCFPPGSAARRSGLEDSVERYRSIAEQQSTRAAGLWARVEQGRTLIELGDRDRGLDLLDGILRLPATETLIERLQVRALAATLACWLETPDRRDDSGFDERLRRQVLRLGPPETLDADALAAQYAAAELLLRRVEAIPPNDRLRRQQLIEDVRQLATAVARTGGDQAAAARDLLERLDGRGRAAAGRLRQTFDAAVDRARQAIAAMQSDPTDSRRAAAREQIREALAAGAADPPDDPATRRQQLLQLRYQLAFVMYESHRYHEAAAIGEQFLMTAPAEPISRKAATIALASWQALRAQPNTTWGRAAVGELARLTEVIMRQWPEDAESAGAAMLAIELAATAADRAAIETILAGLSLSSSGRAEVLLRGGMALWQLCGSAGESVGEPESDTADSCASGAADRLDEGLQLIAGERPLASPDVPLAAAAAVARCQIALTVGGEAAEGLFPLLTHPLYGPWTLLREPEAGYSQQLVEAGLTCCLRGFTTTGRFARALEAITALEQQLAGDEAAAVRLAATAGVLGRGLLEELEAAATALPGQDLAPSLQLLSRLLTIAAAAPAPRAVTIWAAATLARLGQAEGTLDGVVPRPLRRELLERAAGATERLLATSGGPEQTALRLQLARLWTAVGRWQEALEQIDLVVRDPRAGRLVLVQREVAELLEAIAREQPDAAEACRRFQDAAVGRGAAWGWGGLAARISRQAFAGNDDENLQFRRLYFEARYRLAGCRLAWARREADAAARRRQFRQAAAEIEIEARLHPTLGGEDFRQRFEQLRAALSQELQEPLGDQP